MRRALAAAVCALALGSLPADASAATQDVSILFADFSPTPVDALPGETVQWSNVSERRHTVTSDDDLFDSGDLFDGDRYSQTFTTVGAFPYHCTVHPGMIGRVDVRRVTLGPLPTATVRIDSGVQFEGRTADPARPIAIELDSGGGFHPVGSAAPAADGNWKTTVKVQSTGDYRAAVGTDVSQARRLLVSSRKVILRRTRRGVAVRVTPPVPYGRIVLQQRLRERFGWWPARRARLDFTSRAAFRVKRPARVRVALVGRDAWTPLATSGVLTLGSAKRRRHKPTQRPHHMEEMH